ncbi:hypothetical protein [Pseudomonas typographi]|uniref:Uncharacterized protein n=1 Tax=Pseudomonas typographi TaxID=2715964 RepID=A0ABR7Z3N5_9PSED|nr:hypothetical protein [Pseudomonas typographi]MBD1551949.1 hypothetical protein [Pseudomonas typographi]MBD1586513.1 hypothetical protein [Pseudomonas typographi]MBD1600014.1 hypothetical protein [Pseudomonas typographi]
MGIAAKDLCQHVIQPTLAYLGQRPRRNAQALLLGIAASQSRLGGALCARRGHGLYGIDKTRHTLLWDRYLALDPHLASRVRGLASQHAFFTGPELELTVNLRYATAIAWLLVQHEHPQLPPASDVMAMARIWKAVFHPSGRLRDFADAWRNCVSEPEHILD